MFRQYYAKPNQFHFTKSDNSCDVCGSFREFTPCAATKIVELNVLDSTILIYHTGKHTCEAREPSMSFNIFENKQHKTATQISEVAIINCLKDEELDWEIFQTLQIPLLNVRNFIIQRAGATTWTQLRSIGKS